MIGIFDKFYNKWNIVDSPSGKEWHTNSPQVKYVIQAVMVHQGPLFNTHKDVLPQSGNWESEDV